MRPFLLAILALVMALSPLSLAAPARAQSNPAGIPLNEDAKTLTPEEKEKQAKADAAYRAALKKIPDAKPVDPWGNVREAEPAKPAKAKAGAK